VNQRAEEGRQKMEQAEESFLRNTLEKGTEEEQKKLHGKFRQTTVLIKSIEEKERSCCT
jgi:septal ring factor EnvC (AmiA/AmiB activator)